MRTVRRSESAAGQRQVRRQVVGEALAVEEAQQGRDLGVEADRQPTAGERPRKAE
jgi:hypothetical protein